MVEEVKENQCLEGGKVVWYAVRTFNCKEKEISQFFTESGLTHFIPMLYKVDKRKAGKSQRVLATVVHNLLFVQKTLSEKEILKIVSGCNWPLQIFRKIDSNECYEIPDSQMTEFRALCDQNFEDASFIEPEEIEAKVGKNVRIIHGPFTGMTGKLVRFNNKFFFVKSVVGLGVMIHVSRWYCEVEKD